jgi:hypothetical protein
VTSQVTSKVTHPVIRLAFRDRVDSVPTSENTHPSDIVRRYHSAVVAIEDHPGSRKVSRYVKEADEAIERIKALLTDPDEKIASSAFASLPGSILDPYRSYVEIHGTAWVPRLHSNALQHRSWHDASKLWGIIAKRAISQAVDEGVILTPLLYSLFVSATSIRSHFEDPGTKSTPLGAGLDEAMAVFADWIESAGREDLLAFRNHAGGFFCALVAGRSRLVASPDTLLELAPFLERNLYSALGNRHLTSDSLETLVDFAILKTAETDDDTSRDKDTLAFWLTAAKNGVGLNHRQLTLVRMMAESCRHSYGDKEVTQGFSLAAIREAGTDPQIRSALLDLSPSTATYYTEVLNRRKVRMLYSSQGPAWSALLADVLEKPVPETSSEDFTALEVAVRAASGWNLQGVTAGDLLLLVENGDERIRALGLELMARPEIRQNLQGRSRQAR